MNIGFTLNGREVFSSDASLSLLRFIRDVEHLKGTKEGCSTGHCGACTVLIDGYPRRACKIKISDVRGKEVTTIEGLTDDRIQNAFLESGAVQCGFCTPGMILSAKALLDRNHCLSREEIRRALSANYCRCTGYTKIIKAVELAASRLYPAEWKNEKREALEDVEIINQDGSKVESSFHYLGKPEKDADGWKKDSGTLL